MNREKLITEMLEDRFVYLHLAFENGQQGKLKEADFCYNRSREIQKEIWDEINNRNEEK